jgi:hypothetical protein
MTETYTVTRHTRTIIQYGNLEVGRADQFTLHSAVTGDLLAGPQDHPWSENDAELIWITGN